MKKTKLIRGFICFLILLSGCTEKTPDKESVREQSAETPDNQSDNQAYASQSVDEQMARNISNFLIHQYLKDDLLFLTENDRKFQFYKIDLNHDNKEEYFVRFLSPYFCGTGGCTMLLLDRYAEIITKFTVMKPPLYVSAGAENGWRTMLIDSEGQFRKLIFNGKTYPSNPSILPVSSKRPDNQYEILFDDEKHPAKTYRF
jgi:hypothetical protein